MATPAIEIEDLVFEYRSNWLFKKIPVLKGISLSIREGEAFGFLGHNGAGKTTTIKCVLGLLREISGHININGLSSRDLKARERVGYLPEQPYFYDNLTVMEILELYARLCGLSLKDARMKGAAAIERTGIGFKRDARLRSLSKGLMQRVGLAQAIVANPKLLILDEPFSGLDPVGRREFREIFFELKEGGTTLFMSSHILSDVEHLCDRATIMINGAIKATHEIRGETSFASNRYEINLERNDKSLTLFPNYPREEAGHSLRWVFSSNEEGEAALKEALEAGVKVRSYGALSQTLEQLFVELIDKERGSSL